MYFTKTGEDKMTIDVQVEELKQQIRLSHLDNTLDLLNTIWKKYPDFKFILDRLQPLSLAPFSHQFPSLHVPKEHEYLYRILPQIPVNLQIDFLSRFIEYLTMLPKINFTMDNAYTSVGRSESINPIQDYFKALDSHKGLAALYYAWEALSQKKVTTLLNRMHEETVHVISNNLGHYFTCGESLIKLALKCPEPSVKNHLMAITLNLMQAFPAPTKPEIDATLNIPEVVSDVIHRGSFVGYHYLIVTNALLQNKSTFSVDLIQEGFTTLHGMAQRLPLSHPPSSLEGYSKLNHNQSLNTEALTNAILQGNTKNAKSIVHAYLAEYQITNDLLVSILHAFTRINKHPHDPHFLTFPVAVTQLINQIDIIDAEILLHHLIEYATDNIQHYGTL